MLSQNVEVNNEPKSQTITDLKLLKSMTNRELGFELGKLAREESKITNTILKLINLAEERRAYVEHGYPRMFEWLVKGFKYSEPAANRRLAAARLLKAVPDAREKFESGNLNLTTLSKAQSVIRAQEKITQQKVSSQVKAEIIKNIDSKSVREAEQVLFAMLPEAASTVKEERTTVINESITRHAMNFSKEMDDNLKRAKEVLSHKFPNASDADIVGYALNFLLDKIDPLRKSESRSVAAKQSVKNQQPKPADKSCDMKSKLEACSNLDTDITTNKIKDHGNQSSEKPVSKAKAKRLTLKSSNGGCVFVDEVTGHVCGDRYQVQPDHIIPKAFGGTDELGNLRPLCRQHNILMAERVFGKAHMDQFRRNQD